MIRFLTALGAVVCLTVLGFVIHAASGPERAYGEIAKPLSSCGSVAPGGHLRLSPDGLNLRLLFGHQLLAGESADLYTALSKRLGDVDLEVRRGTG